MRFEGIWAGFYIPITHRYEYLQLNIMRVSQEPIRRQISHTHEPELEKPLMGAIDSLISMKWVFSILFTTP